jgi:cytochrome c oxidase assembly factor CtaG/cytochrome c2
MTLLDSLRQQGWTLDPLLLAGLALGALFYALGLRGLWRRAGAGRGVAVWQASAFVCGWSILTVSLVSPLHALGESLFSMHMLQHELLLLLAAPLCVLGRPLAVVLWAAPPRPRARIARLFRGPAFRRAWRTLTSPLAGFLLLSAVLWIWHAPPLYQASLRSELLHAVQHTTYLLASGLFWWALFHGRVGRQGYGVAAAAVFGIAVQGGVLGALIAVARGPWYAVYAARTPAWGLSALEDQQLAGILMWVPAGILLSGFGLALFARWMSEAERRVRFAEAGRRGGAIGGMLCAALLAAAAAASGCQETAAAKAARMTGGDPDAGRAAIRRYGCGSCHEIRGVPGAAGNVGPPLTGLVKRAYVAGNLTNDPDHLEAWIRNPQHLHPPTAMPDTGVTSRDARDMAAYLYSLP